MVVDIEKLSNALRRNSPEEELRRDLERIIGAHRQQIHDALAAGQSYVLRVPDGRRIRIAPRLGSSLGSNLGSSLAPSLVPTAS